MARHVLGLPTGDGWSQDWTNTVKDQVSFYSGHLSDCSAWTLPVGIRKADGPRWSSSVRRDVQSVQCRRVSFQGGIPRDARDGVKPASGTGREEKPGEIEPSACVSLGVFRSIKKKENTSALPPYTHKGRKQNPTLVNPQDVKARLQTVLRMGMLDFFTARVSQSPQLLPISPSRALERRAGALGWEGWLTCHGNVLCFYMLHCLFAC